MNIRRLAIAATTTVAVTSTVVAAPAANAYTVDYDATTEKCTITYTERDQERINTAYKNIYLLLADQLMNTLGQKASTDRYPQEQRKADAKLYGDWAKTAIETDKDPNAWAPDPEVKEAQSRIYYQERKNYNMYIALLKASKTDKITEREEVITPAEAEKRGEALGLDIKGLLGGLGLTGLLGGALGGFDDITNSVKAMVKNDVLQVAAPVVAYTGSLSACAEGENKSSSVPAGSSLSLKGLGIAIGAGFAGLLILSGILGFALRPFVDQFLAKK